MIAQSVADILSDHVSRVSSRLALQSDLLGEAAEPRIKGWPRP
jgi:hypothetical protein